MGVPGRSDWLTCKPERLAAAQEIEQVLRPERFVVDEHTHRVEVHGLDAPQIPLDHLGVIRAAPQPRFEVVAVGQANPAGGHVVHAIRLPRLAAQPEPAVARLDELRFRLGLPHAQLMAQPVNRRPGQRQTDRDAGFAGIPDKAILLHRLRLPGRERNLPVEHRPARSAFGIEELHRDVKVADRLLAEVHHARPGLELLPRKDREELAAAFAEEDAPSHARQHLAQAIRHDRLAGKSPPLPA